MRRKINVQLISISIIAIISTMLVMLFVFYDLFQTQVQDDLSANAIVLKNTGSTKVNLSGWKVLSVKGSQIFTFPDYVLSPNTTVKVGDSSKNTVDLHWMEGKGVWNNSESDPAEIYDNTGKLVDRLEN